MIWCNRTRRRTRNTPSKCRPIFDAIDRWCDDMSFAFADSFSLNRRNRNKPSKQGRHTSRHSINAWWTLLWKVWRFPIHICCPKFHFAWIYVTGPIWVNLCRRKISEWLVSLIVFCLFILSATDTTFPLQSHRVLSGKVLRRISWRTHP